MNNRMSCTSPWCERFLTTILMWSHDQGHTKGCVALQDRLRLTCSAGVLMSNPPTEDGNPMSHRIASRGRTLHFVSVALTAAGSEQFPNLAMVNSARDLFGADIGGAA